MYARKGQSGKVDFKIDTQEFNLSENWLLATRRTNLDKQNYKYTTGIISPYHRMFRHLLGHLFQSFQFF